MSDFCLGAVAQGGDGAERVRGVVEARTGTVAHADERTLRVPDERGAGARGSFTIRAQLMLPEVNLDDRRAKRNSKSDIVACVIPVPGPASLPPNRPVRVDPLQGTLVVARLSHFVEARPPSTVAVRCLGR